MLNEDTMGAMKSLNPFDTISICFAYFFKNSLFRLNESETCLFNCSMSSGKCSFLASSNSIRLLSDSWNEISPFIPKSVISLICLSRSFFSGRPLREISHSTSRASTFVNVLSKSIIKCCCFSVNFTVQ